MKLQIGMQFIDDIAEFESSRPVRFLTDDGRCVFEVSMHDDGSLDVRAIDVTNINGVLRDTILQVSPRATNSIVVSTSAYNHGGKK